MEKQEPRNMNTVSGEALQQVAQIDRQNVTDFVDKRREKGGFTSWQQIKDDVPGFDEVVISRLKQAGFGFGRTDMKAA
jgi:DNA uptake protein ComE-like DNA-binding protein